MYAVMNSKVHVDALTVREILILQVAALLLYNTAQLAGAFVDILYI